MKLYTIPFIVLIFLIACTSSETETTENEIIETVDEIVEEKPIELNEDSLMNAIDTHRATVESSVEEPLSINTEGLREKIQQKWEKIHFYSLDNQLVRVKTYPYPEISERTEEFYFINENLVLVVIQDNGLNEERGSEGENLDKVLYFNNGELFAEKGEKVTEEYENMEAEEAELNQEAAEYMEIFLVNTEQ